MIFVTYLGVDSLHELLELIHGGFGLSSGAHAAHYLLCPRQGSAEALVHLVVVQRILDVSKWENKNSSEKVREREKINKSYRALLAKKSLATITYRTTI